jgi:hypothetical protein
MTRDKSATERLLFLARPAGAVVVVSTAVRVRGRQFIKHDHFNLLNSGKRRREHSLGHASLEAAIGNARRTKEDRTDVGGHLVKLESKRAPDPNWRKFLEPTFSGGGLWRYDRKYLAVARRPP